MSSLRSQTLWLLQQYLMCHSLDMKVSVSEGRQEVAANSVISYLKQETYPDHNPISYTASNFGKTEIVPSKEPFEETIKQYKKNPENMMHFNTETSRRLSEA